MKVLHIGHLDKFTSDFIDFLEDNFDISEHEFRFFGRKEKYSLSPSNNIFIESDVPWLNPLKMFYLIKSMASSDKIIIHGLINSDLVKLLWLMPWFLKKSYWIILGLDLYRYQKRNDSLSNQIREFFRRKVIRDIGHIVTYIKGDYNLAKQWYGAKAKYHECFMYPSNLYKEYDLQQKQHTSINILVGNSADPSNNHLEVLDKLEVYRNECIKIYAPLSYGNPQYAKLVIEEGKKRFDSKFIPLTKMMPFQDYLEFLGLIDIAIFNHKRQQAMGNAITLLGLGKKLYMRSDVTPWEFFTRHGIMVFDIEGFNLKVLEAEKVQHNRKYIKDYFSVKNYQQQLTEIFR